MFCGQTQEPASATADPTNTREGFVKSEDGWTGTVEFRNNEIHGSRRSMRGYILTGYSREML